MKSWVENEDICMKVMKTISFGKWVVSVDSEDMKNSDRYKRDKREKVKIMNGYERDKSKASFGLGHDRHECVAFS